MREFAGQANTVATMILNNQIDLDVSRAYSSIARTIAQAISAETARARFLRSAPNFEFEKGMFEGK